MNLIIHLRLSSVIASYCWTEKDLTGIYKEAQRASEVIKDFMGFAIKQPQPKQLFDINDFIKYVLKPRKFAQKNKITVKINFNPDLPLVKLGHVRMRQVFMDIITSTEYFMFQAHNKGILTVTTEKSGEVVRAYFTADTPGISPETLGAAIQPFFTTKEVGKSIGLGLSFCHNIISEHGDRIYIESEPVKGVTFVVEPPISRE